MKNKLICKRCNNDTFKIGFEVDPNHAVAVDQINNIVCARCGKESN